MFGCGVCRAAESQDYASAVEAYTAALAVDPQHKVVNKDLHLRLCRVQQQLGKGDEAVQVGAAAVHTNQLHNSSSSSRGSTVLTR